MCFVDLGKEFDVVPDVFCHCGRWSDNKGFGASPVLSESLVWFVVSNTSSKLNPLLVNVVL